MGTANMGYRVRGYGGLPHEETFVPAIILATAAPKFADGGDVLLCELESNGQVWNFGISWSHTEIALPACAEALEAHRDRSRNVVAFRSLQLVSG